MRKFLLYSLGVLAMLNTAVVHAVEKFEVLPDLPDPLAYAVQPAQAAAVSGTTDVSALTAQSIGNEPSMLSVLLSLVFVILLIYMTGIIYAKLNKVGFKTMKKQQGDFARHHVSVVSTTQLGNNKTLHVVELDGKRMLIGASSSAIQLIKDLGTTNRLESDEEYSHIEIPNIKIPKIEIPKIEIPKRTYNDIKYFEEKALGSEKTLKDLSKELNYVDKKKYLKNPEAYRGITTQFYKGLRLLLTHQEHGIAMDDIVSVLGHDEVIRRLKLEL